MGTVPSDSGGSFIAQPKYGLGYNLGLPRKIKVKKVSSNPIMIQIYETVEDKLKESRPSVFDRIQSENVRVSVFERLERETSTIVNPRGRMSIFQRLSGDSSTSVQVDKDAQVSSESIQRQSIFSRLGVKTSNSCLKPQQSRKKNKNRRTVPSQKNSEHKEESKEESKYFNLLQEYKDVFAWSYKEMPGLDPKVAVHHLAGYNQIRMNPKDEELTAFRTPKGIYCYKVMPFGLKNAGATYQRAMQKVFDDMMHKQVECYVDDLVVKTKKREDHLQDLQDVFKRLRRYQLKMNPLKCAFGVTSGKFLGFIVRHRAQESSLGALLVQINDEGKENALYYLSRTLVGAEMNYSPIEKICLALIFAAKKLRHYMLAHTINLVSKIDPLKYIMSRPILSGRIGKWALLLSEFDIKFIPQKAVKGQALADFLADHPIPTEWELPKTFQTKKFFSLKLYLLGGYSLMVQLEDMVLEQELYLLLSIIRNENREADALANLAAVLARILWILPKKCEACQVHANFIHRPPELLHPTIASWPFDAWGLDVIGPITPKSSAGHSYIIAGTDYFSKWAEAMPLREVKKENVADFIRSQIIYRYGIPRYIITDNGKPFCNSHINNLCTKFGFRQYNSSMYNAAANGLAEAFNKTLCNLLKKIVSKSKRDWHERIGEALWAYRTTYRTPTQATPYSLVYGVEAVLP
ncbi:Ribonuclease H [Abeliophyllum distichum]|uniref:Ribonuclease H n=1 Tax=Abeliophyllum distichum TaxID=126358 RepID=A0ABD1SYG6_9LAMI